MNTPYPLRPDMLRWAIFLALVAPLPVLAEPALIPSRGPGGLPLINDSHGVPVIDIVAPNGQGLSHNQFLDYNVGTAGLVLNNALQPGQSQLAGALAANPQFTGQAASTILNEVVSRQASVIEGPQEIFGRAADYVLANPNGITLNGGTFINTTRAGFVVGEAELDGERLQRFDTRTASGSLQVGPAGQRNSSGALDLIAPRIDSVGDVLARGDLNIVAGRNQLDAGSGDVLQHLPGTPSSVDASLLGAMYAGRIRIVSTAEGAGVRIGNGGVAGREGLSIRSAGDLHVRGDGQRAAELRSRLGALTLDAAGDIHLQATQGEGKTLAVNAGQALTLDGARQEQITRDRDAWSDGWWFVTTETYAKDTTTTTGTLQATSLKAAGDLSLRSGDDLRVEAANVDAGGTLALNSGGSLVIQAGHDDQRTVEQVRHRKHLWRGDTDSDRYQETLRPSDLKGAKVVLNAKDNLSVQGSQVHSSGDLELRARDVAIDPATLKGTQDEKRYRGDLVSGHFFGNQHDQSGAGDTQVGSKLTADGRLDVFADQVTLTGSTLKSKGDALLHSDKGALTVNAGQSVTTKTDDDRSSQVFGLFGDQRKQTDRTQAALTSDLRSDTNLRLVSADTLTLEGARVEAGQHLQLEAKGDMTVTSAQNTQETTLDTHQRGLNARAGQTKDAQDGKPGSKQYSANVGYDVRNEHSRQRDTQQVASVLKGGDVSLESGAHLQVNGSQVTATQGDIALRGPQVTLGATSNERLTSTDRHSAGGSLEVTGGIDRIGSAFEGHSARRQTHGRDTSVVRTELEAAGDLRIDTDTLVTEGAKVRAGQTLAVTAKRIENRAVDGVQEHEQVDTEWRGSLGGSLEYRDITRPIERLVAGEEAARFQQAATEDAMVAPSLGADMIVEHLKRLENQRRGFAQVSELSGAAVQVKAQQIDDQGTAWRAEDGALRIEAERHTVLAARDTERRTVERLDAGGDLRVDTSTGSDVNVRASGKGGSQRTEDTLATARPGSLYGKQGVQIQLGSDGRYEGTRFDGGEGDVRIASGGTLSLEQASDERHETLGKLDGNAWVKVGNRPTNIGGDGRGYLDQHVRDSTKTTAQVAQIDAKGSVVLTSAGDLTLQGTRIGTREAPVGGVTVDAGGMLKVSAAQDSERTTGKKLGGGAELALKTGASKGGAVGGHFTNGTEDTLEQRAQVAHIDTTGTLTLSSQAQDDAAVHLQGLQASAKHLVLSAQRGGVWVEAAENRSVRNNLEITAGAGFAMATGATADATTRGLHGRAQVALDKRNDQTWTNSTLRADSVRLDSRGDSRFEGATVETGSLSGAVGGDLLLVSRKDQVDRLTVNADARLSKEKNPQGYLNALSAVTGPAADKVKDKVGGAVSKADPGVSPTFKLELSHEQRDTVAQATAFKATDGIDLKVGGDAKLVGARLQSANGNVALQAASITRETLSGRDYRRDVSVDASNSLVDLGTAIADIAKTKGGASGENALDLGLLRTSGHNRSEQWTSSVQGMDKR